MISAQDLLMMYGELFAPDNENRIHFDGCKLLGSGPWVCILSSKDDQLFMTTNLDPMSPIGQILASYEIPCVPDLRKAHLCISATEDREKIRMEICVQDKDADGNEIEFTYGIKVKAADCCGYIEIK